MAISLTARSRIEDVALTLTVFGLSYGALNWIGIGEYSVLKVSGTITLLFGALVVLSKYGFTFLRTQEHSKHLLLEDKSRSYYDYDYSYDAARGQDSD